MEKSAESTHSRYEAAEGDRTVWKAMLTVDGILRRLRLSREPERNLHLILESARPLLQSEALYWLPSHSDVPSWTCGKPVLSITEANRLVGLLAQESDYAFPTPYTNNRPNVSAWGNSFPNVHSLLVLHASDPDAGPLGAVLAVNKHGEGGFRKTDSVVLAPFVGLIEMYGRSLGRVNEIKKLLIGLTRSLTAAIDAKEPSASGHSERVARIAVETAKQMELPECDLGDVYLAGLLHDIGKIGVRDTVLRKVGPLTTEEWEHLKQHVSIGYSILADLRGLGDLLPGVLYHHENYDGTGYPDGLKGEEIPLLARILSVADAYDAMCSNHLYRESMSLLEVERRLREGAGTQWDPKVVDALLRGRHAVHALRFGGSGESLRLAVDAALDHEQNVEPELVRVGGSRLIPRM
jgi:HD-GYP domain-containing protein (c-di-GMP phosphodiesterase class II)